MAETQEIGCTCRCRIGLEVVQPESIGLQLEQFHIGFADVPTLVISGEGGSKSIEQWYLMAEALGMTVITDSEITTEAESLWSDPTAEAHDAEDLATIEVDLQGGAMEEFWDIPEEIDIQAVSSTKIINELTAQWAAQTA